MDEVLSLNINNLNNYSSLIYVMKCTTFSYKLCLSKGSESSSHSQEIKDKFFQRRNNLRNPETRAIIRRDEQEPLSEEMIPSADMKAGIIDLMVTT